MTDPGRSSLPPPPRAPSPSAWGGPFGPWAPYVSTMVVCVVIAGLFVLDGLTPAERGPDRDRHGDYVAAGFVELEAATIYGVYAGFGSEGPRNPRVDLDGDLIPLTTASRTRDGRVERAVRFLTSEAGVYRVRVDSPRSSTGIVGIASFSVGDDPLVRREATETWPFVGAALALVGALFVWGLGWDHTRPR